MPARRAQLGLAVAGVILGTVLVAFLLRQGGEDLQAGGEGPEAAASGVPNEAGAETLPAPGPGRIDPSLEGGSGAGDRVGLAPPPHVLATGPVDLIIVDETGAGLLESAESPLSPDVIFWLEPVLIEGRTVPATVPAGAKRLRKVGSRVSATPGWYTAFDRPTGEALVALLYGDRIVCIEPVPPGGDEVVLVATEADIAALHCTVRGAIDGLDGAGHHVRVQPIGREGQVLAPIVGQGEGEHFLVPKVPPGRAQLIVRYDPGILVQNLIQSAPAGRAISLGARVVDAEQWQYRLETLGRIRQPWLVMDLELVPGEDRDLGRLVESQAGAILMALLDGQGNPVPAHSVDVRVLTPPGSAIPHPQSWTFENLAILHPLPVALLQLTVVQGDVGALVSIRPSPLGPGTTGLPETQSVLTPLSVVSLPDRPGAQLLTESGAKLVSDPRWSGGRYMGHSIGEQTMLVPEGRYRFEPGEGGSFSTVDIGAGMFMDLRESPASPSPLTPADRKARAARRR